MTNRPNPSDDLYFFRTGTDAVKIGRAAQPKKRLRELQVGNHEQMHCWVCLKGRGSEEKRWHRAFSRWHLRGEWFAFSPQLMSATVLARCGQNWLEALNED